MSKKVIRSTSEKIWLAITLIATGFLAILMLYPLFYIILGSFKTNKELLLGGANIFPKHFSLSNYKEAWAAANFSVYTKNSVYLGVGVMCITVVVTSMAGYVFSRKNFRGKEFIYGCFLAFMFVNVGSVTLRPLFELAVDLKLNKSLITVIILSAGTGQATFIFLARGFVNSIPKEIDEAAKIDGCSFGQIFFRILFPLMTPITSTIALLSFRHGWNEYILPLVFTISNKDMRPLTVGVNMLKNAGDGAAAWNIMFAGATLAVVPIVLIFLIFNKQFMKETTAGAVKG